MADGIRAHVHDLTDEHRLARILRLAAIAGRPRPLAETLNALCAELAELLTADVVSVYVKEVDDEGDVLVMRANVGFPAEAIGRVRLRVGEGMTGLVAECLRPVSVAVATADPRNKPFPELGEDHFPAFLGLPLAIGASASGVLVLQRRETRAFEPAEVELAAALTAPFASAIGWAAARQAEDRVDDTGRSARLSGTALAPGVAIGPAQLVGASSSAVPADPVAAALAALDSLAADARRGWSQVSPLLAEDARRGAMGVLAILEDGRLREHAEQAVKKLGLDGGLAEVAKGAAKQLAGGGQLAAERAHEIEELFLLVGARSRGGKTPGPGGVLALDRLGVLVALVAAGVRSAAIVVGGPAEESTEGAVVARAAALPVVAEVAGLYTWARERDRIFVDGDRGLVRVNPPAAVVARWRRQAGR